MSVNNQLPVLTPEYMFKYQERLLQKIASETNPDVVAALKRREAQIDVFMDACCIHTLIENAPIMTIDPKMFDLPLLANVLGISQAPDQLKIDFNPQRTIEVEEVKPIPVEDELTVDDVFLSKILELDLSNEKIARAVTLLKKGLSESTNFNKHIKAAVQSVRKEVELPADIDEFSIFNALIKDLPFDELKSLKEKAVDLFHIGLTEQHAINLALNVKADFPEWSDEAIASFVAFMVSRGSNSMQHHDILNANRKIITELTKTPEVIARVAKLYPKVSYSRIVKSTGEREYELIPGTDPRAGAFQIAKLYNLCSLEKRAKAAHRIYVEKGYPAQ